MRYAQAMSTDASIERFMARKRETLEPAPPAAGPAPGQPEDIRPQPSGGSVVGAIASDIGRGFVEAPSAIGKGIYNAAHSAAKGLSDLGDWLNSKIDLRVDVPLTGYDTLDKIISNPLSAVTEPGKLSKPDSVTGNVIYEGARFLTGFVPALRAMKAGGVGQAAASIGAGGIAEFVTQDPSEKNLSALLRSVTDLKDPVTEYLATDPDSTQGLNRLRHAVEGLGFGVLTEGLVRAIRAVAHAKKAQPEIALQRQKYGETDETTKTLLGDPTKPLVTIDTGVPDQVAAKGLSAAATKGRAATEVAGEPQVYINFGRIESPDDVQTVIRDMANAFKGEIDEARRGIQTNRQTKALADDLGMTVDDLLARRAGQPFSAEESLAARRLWAGSGEKLLEAARLAADGNAGPADLYNFRRMLAIHHSIQTEVIAARTETARALQAWSIPAGGGVERARQIQALLEGSGGADVSAELARRLSTLSGQDLPSGALAEVVRRGWAATSLDAVKEAYVLGLLWSPTTHMVNSISNTAVAFQSVYERAVASRIGDFLGSAADARVVDGEALAMTYGMITSLKDAFTLGARALRTGESSALGKIDLPHQRVISSETVARERALGVGEAQAFVESPMGRAIDFIGAVNGVPGNLLAGADEFFKTITYRAEVHAHALRTATQEGLSGPDLFRRMAEIANAPPEHIRLAAADAALYTTFQQTPGDFAQSLLRMRNSGTLNPVFLIVPFIKTPANILRYTFERTPLAPLVSQWRDDIAAGGARRDLAVARMATGSAITAVAMDYASSGLITGAGPSDPAKREALERQGWKPYSIYIGGKYYSYSRLDPMGMLLGFAGTVAERVKAKEHGPDKFDEWEEILAAGVGAVSASVVDKTYFQGITNILDIIKGTQRGERGFERYVDKQTGSLLPLSSAFGAMKRFADPVTREVNSPWDAIQAKIAGMSDHLPPARDLWGNERKPAEVYGRVFDAFSPVAVSQDKDSPIDAEIERLGAGVRRIQQKTSFDGVQIDFRDFPEVYDEYVRLAGNELKHPAWGKGAKEYLDDVVSGRDSMSQIYARLHSDGPEGTKIDFIRNKVSEFRKLAQQHIMAQKDRWPEFIAKVESEKGRLQELKMPPGLGGSSRLP